MNKLDKIFDKMTVKQKHRIGYKNLAELYWKMYKLIEQEKEDAKCEQMIEDGVKNYRVMAHLHQYIRRNDFLLFA